jgi:transcriptional regulator with XRE-family HTH domain
MKLVKTREEFAEWCKRNGFSREELADALDITRQTLYNWTRLKRRSDKISSEVKTDLEKNEREIAPIPRMLALSLFALESLPDEAKIYGQTVQKEKIKVGR